MSLFLAFLRLFAGRIRRNHALEHATIHVLTGRHPHLSLVGFSDWGGYSIYGPLEPEELATAAEEALTRLRAGERHLAIHPRCGTVLATMGLLGGLAAFLAMGLNRSHSRFRWSSLPDVLAATSAGVIIGQPVGLLLQQRLTTSADMGDLRVVRVFRRGGTSLPVLRVETN